MKNPLRFYVYAYLREDGSPYYIGKGCGDRCLRSEGKPCRVPKDRLRIVKLCDGIPENVAFELEVWLIAGIGRKDIETGPLLNRSNGGEGPSGWVPSIEQRRKMSEAKQGKSRPVDTYLKMISTSCTRSYRITSPDGMVFDITNVKAFAKENGLNQGNLCSVARGRLTHHKGFKVEYSDAH